ncbi:Homocysteine S-methyltransferase [Pseudomassariella vexata]|uniref:Homocysteine S-methyltransferase n=1 Tax=Pseudomassariella vexata TaxID=1141098 RepID=A0A1Y2EKH5_9PEZI|nr:Homocysteine S-methyltransferase [Pseudomassariella vexata]ORY72043.1 Homocysteine S-methyltransferase [Pseudomassariella vexata]
MTSIQILDGGLGTSLEDSYGVKFDHTNPLWSTHFLLTNQSTLLACQRDFSIAGADVLLTATYQTSIEGFARTKTDDFPDGIPKDVIGKYLVAAVDIAENASVREEAAKLALSLGPYGASMIPGQEYSGQYDAAHSTEEELFQWHLERLRLFTAVEGLMSRVKYVAFETLPRLDEVRAVRRAIWAAGMETKFWVSCVFPGEGEGLPDGSSVEEVVQAMVGDLEGAGRPWGVGLNCTKIHKVPGLIGKFEEALEKMGVVGVEGMPALVLYPDGTNGEVYNTTTKIWEKPEGKVDSDGAKESWGAQLASAVQSAQARGCFKSFLVGGCCKASASDIKKLREHFHKELNT